MDLREGHVLGGYRIVRLLGRGGMGAVYLAEDLHLGRKVALKILGGDASDDSGVRARFLRESRMAASLDHPHILPIYEAGEADGQLFIAMRYVPGLDLAGTLRRDGPLDFHRATMIVDQVAGALDAAHAAGLIHRDVKPGNILVDAGSRPGADHAYLSDFGLTKQAEPGEPLTRSGQLMGTVGYVAPEQIEGRPIDGRVDVYSLGCVLYECLAGDQPFPRESEMATLYAQVNEPVPSLAGARPELPPAIDAVIAKAMAKSPNDRYQSPGHLADALSSVKGQLSAQAQHLTRGFLFADLRGYTAFAERRGDEAAADLLDAYRRLVREVVRRFGGAEIKTEGDSFYVVFPSASGAVRCGLAIVESAAAATREHGERPIDVGIGIHAGESAETEEGYVGSAVNLASRVCSQAAPGEVLVTDTVRGLARTSGQIAFRPRGRKHLKGVAEPVAVFAATDAAATVARADTPVIGLSRLRESRGLTLSAVVAGATALAIVGLLVAGALGGARPSIPADRPVGSAGASLTSASAGATSPAPSGRFFLPSNDVGELPPGTYSTTRFQRQLTITLPVGWRTSGDFPDGVGIGPVGSSSVTEMVFVVIQTIFDSNCPPKRIVVGPTAQALVTALQARTDLAVSEPLAVSYGDVTGLLVDLTPRPVKCAANRDGVPLFQISEQNTAMSGPGLTRRLVVLDVGNRAIAIDVFAPSLDEFWPAADGVLRSLKFESGP